MTAESSLPTIETPAHTSETEVTRAAAVARYDILDTPPDGAFDRIAALAARMLDAPIATVSIVDTDRVWFKAAHGLDGVTQVGRDPGLCASAILQGEPYAVEDAHTDPRTAQNPLVHGELGVRFYAAAPITTADGQRLGTVNVLDTHPRKISETETAALQELAAVVMDELDLRLSALTTLRHERELREQVAQFAATLQHTLLPPTLPRVPGLETACHYHAADPSAVTGDFYDVFSLGNGRWAFFLGDVAGHGVEAATVTALTRHTLRAAALHNPTRPDVGLAELNTALLQDPNVRHTCTVLFGSMEPHPNGGFAITLAGGGHPPALWLHPGDHTVTVTPVWPAGGMLVGALPEASFATSQLHLRPGQSLLLYTDGLTEARPDGEFFDEQRLTDFLADRPDTSADVLIADLIELIAGFDPAPTDDVALLALSVPS